MANLPSGTVTFLFSDIEGSTKLWEEHPEQMRAALARHDVLLRGAIERHGGHVFKTVGDAFFAAFADASGAVNAAIDAQEGIFREPWPSETPVRVRMAVSTGSAEFRDNDYFGVPLNRAARLLAVGHGGQVLLAPATCDLLHSKFRVVDLGVHRLRDLPQAERVYQLEHAHLPADLPPLRSLSISIHNLPQQLTAFVGREREVHDWSEFIRERSRRLFTITGFGGLGKTRISMQIGENLLPDFPDGVYWCSLELASAVDDAVASLAQSLSVPLQPSPGVKEQLFRYLRERNALLILDNLEQLSGGPVLVKELLAETREVVCLITSRRTMELRGETVLELDPMAEMDSVELFRERASECRTDFVVNDDNRSDVAELCKRLEGVPLAIELAAARISGMTPKQILERLNERFRLLQSRSQELNERQRALRGAIDWSYALLSDDDKEVFAQLSAFLGGFTLEDAEAVCEAFDVFETVMALRQQSFLRIVESAGGQEQRFVMLDSLREYGSEKLAATADKGEAVKRRHAERFLKFAQDRLTKLRTAGELDALKDLHKCESNVRAALDWADSADDAVLTAELSLVYGLMRYRRGFLHSAAEVFQAGLEKGRNQSDKNSGLIGRLLLERAGLHYDFRNAAECEALAAEALALFDGIGDVKGIARAENLLGQAKMMQKQFPEAISHYRRAQELFNQAGDKVGVAIALNNHGLALRRDQSGSTDEIAARRASAGEYLGEALNLRRNLDDRRGLAETLNNLGVLSFEMDEFESAWYFYLEALKFERYIDNMHGIGISLANLGEVAGIGSDAELGARLLAASERLLSEVGSPNLDEARKMMDDACSAAGWSASEISGNREMLRGLSVAECIDWALASAKNLSASV